MKKSKVFILVLSLIITVFWCTYCITMVYGSEGKESNKSVEANINDEFLNNEVMISLLPKDNNDEIIKTLSQVKEELNIEGSVSKIELTNKLRDRGYILDESSESEEVIYFNERIKPNRYYIMEHNGYLAIFTSDDNCKLTIEDEESDIYTDAMKYENFNTQDREYFESYGAEFSTKEEAEDYMTQFMS